VRWLQPRAWERSVLDIDYDALQAAGIRALVFDLDNTLSLWRETLDDWAQTFLHTLAGQGLRLAVVSNGRPWGRGEVRCQLAALGIPAIFGARKPLPGAFRRAATLLDVDRRATVVIGDQLFTDVLGAHLAGMDSILVAPLSRREHWITRLLRRAERLCGRK